MNLSQNITLLKNIDLSLTNQSSDLSSITTNTSNANTNIINVNSALSTISGYNNSMNTSLATLTSTNSTIASNITSTNSILATLLGYNSNIQSDVSDLNRKKIIFNGRLTDGTNEYLTRGDYSSSPIYFYWQNDKTVPVYVSRYTLVYQVSTEPTWDLLYSTTAWDSKIGLLNDSETDIVEPYITVKDNFDFMNEENANHIKKSVYIKYLFVCF